MRRNYRFLIALIIIIIGINVRSNAQTVADFKFSFLCYGDQTRFVSKSNSTYTILSYNWDLNNDGLFNDDFGDTIYNLFTYADTFDIGLQVISNMDTSKVYKKVIIQLITPSFTINADSQCLTGNNFIFTNTTTLDPSGSFTNTWYFGDGTFSLSNNTSHIYSQIDKTFQVKLISISDSGCKDSSIYDVTILPNPIPKFTLTDTTNCSGQVFQFKNSSSISYGALQYLWLFGNGRQSTLIDDTSSYASVGTYTVKLKVASTKGCIDSFSRNVYVNDTLIANFSVSPKDTQCWKGHAYTLNNTSRICTTTDSISWDLNGDGIFSDSNGNTVHPKYSIAQTINIGMIIYTGTKSDTAYHTIVIHPSPAASFTINSTSQLLTGNSFIFTNNSIITPSGSLTYYWDYGDGAGTSVDTNPTYNYTTAGIFKVLLTVTSDKGCIDTISKMDTVIAPLLVDFSADSVCLKDSTTFTNKSVSSNPFVQINWDYNNDSIFTDAAGSIAKHLFATAGIHTVGLQIITSTETDTIFKTIIVHPNPVADFSINTTTQVLTGNYFAFTNNSSITPTSSLAYSWDFGDASGTSAVKNPGYSYLISGIFKVNLTVTSLNGCIDSLIKVDTVTSPFAVDFLADSVCFNDSTSFNNTSVSGDPFLQINWDFNNDTIFTDASGSKVKHVFLTSGTHTVGLQIVTASKTDTIFKTIIVHPKPVAGFNINTATQMLSGNSFVFTNTSTISSGNLTYLWDLKDASTATTTDVTHSYAAIGDYYVLLTATSQFGCTDTISKKASVVLFSKSIADFKTDTICYPGAATFTNTSTSANPFLQINWDLDSNGLFDNGTGAIVKYTLPKSGNFYAGIQVMTAFDTSIIYKLVIVNPKPKADFLINRTPQPLSGNNFIYTNASTISPYNPLTFNWSFGDGGTSTAIDTNHSYSALGSYFVRLIAISNKGCSDTVTKQVDLINYILTKDFTAKNVCLGDTMFFTNLSSVISDSIINYLWDFGDGIPTIIRGNPKHVYSDTGTYNVSLIILLLSGNKDTVTKQFTVFPSPSVSINYTPGTTIYMGQTVTLSITGTYDSLIWSTGSKNISIDVTNAGVYSVGVYDSNGCYDTASVKIDVLLKTSIQIVSVFTPNGDGINDYWKILNIGTFGKCEVKIFNRWGDEIYTSSDYKNDWDGKRGGKSLPEGTYYYIINTSNAGTFTGPINILK